MAPNIYRETPAFARQLPGYGAAARKDAKTMGRLSASRRNILPIASLHELCVVQDLHDFVDCIPIAVCRSHAEELFEFAEGGDRFQFSTI